MVASSAIEELAPGVTCEWLDNHQIVVFKVMTSDRNDLAIMFDRMHSIIDEWPADRPYLVLQDLLASAEGMTPYTRARAKAIGSWRPNLEAHVALIIPATFQSRLIRLFVDAQRTPGRVFFSREEGLTWLRQFLIKKG